MCAAQRAALCGCSFFLVRERTNQESGLKGLEPLRNPQDLFLEWSFGGYQKALLYLQFRATKSKDFVATANKSFLLKVYLN